MGAIRGIYSTGDQVVKLSSGDSENISRSQIENICHQMIRDKIKSLTLDFEDGTFIFFQNFKDSVRFIEGVQSDYIRLQHLVKADLDGKIFHFQPDQMPSPANVPEKEESAGPVETDRTILADESVMIQNSFLPDMENLKKTFENAEIYFRPFEAPGGDFYWMNDYGDQILLVVGDCTGHGMQGALMTMSAMTLLGQVFKKDPGSLEDRTAEFYQQFKGMSSGKAADLVDAELGMVLIDKSSGRADYYGSGVNLIVRHGSQHELLKSRKTSVMRGKQKIQSFDLSKGDQFLLFTDGIADQFDKKNKKKLSAKGFMKLVSQQENTINRSMIEDLVDHYRGETEPMDDQTCMCVTY